MKLALCFEWQGKANPMKLRPCAGWHGNCLLDTMHKKRPFELPPYRALTDFLEGKEIEKYDVADHWARPLCLICRIRSMHFSLLTQEGCNITGSDFFMYHDLHFVDVLPEYVIRIPRPCREVESGVAIETQTLVVFSFSQALLVTERGFDVSRVCRPLTH